MSNDDRTAAQPDANPPPVPVSQSITEGSGNIQAYQSTVTATYYQGDQVAGDKVEGDKVLGYKIVQQPDLPPIPPPDPAQAAAALASLRLDRVPTPAKTLPPGSRPVFDPNPLFTGREAELLALAAALKSGDANVISTGIGGVGKTTLAIEAAWRYGPHFLGGVFWVSCAKAENIPAEIAACGGPGALRLQGLAGRPQTEQVEAVLAEWARDIPRLLIFDNCEDPELLREYRPKGGGSRVLITSRNAVWPPSLGAATLALDVLSPDESIALVRRLCVRLSEAEAAQVAEALGRLPLALHLAGSFLERYGTPVSDYLKALASPTLLDHPSMTGRGMKDRPIGRDLHVAKAFALSFDLLDRAETIDAAALALLARAACLAPGEPFPQSLLAASLPVAEGDEDAALDRTDGIARLLELGLVERAGDDALKLHRLLARYVARVVTNESARTNMENAIDALANRLNNAGYPLQWGSMQAQLRHMTEQAQTRTDERAARLCNNLGYLLRAQGDLAGARPYYERAQAIREQALGPQHPDTALSLNNLGALLDSQGDLAGARPYYERAQAIWEQALGPQHPGTARSLNNLGGLLQAQGDLAGARPYYERALAICVIRLGVDHPTTHVVRRNLAALDAPPLSTEQQIAQITAQAEAAVVAALADPSIDRAALTQQLEAVAQQAADGEAEGSPYLALAARLRTLAARLQGEQ